MLLLLFVCKFIFMAYLYYLVITTVNRPSKSIHQKKRPSKSKDSLQVGKLLLPIVRCLKKYCFWHVCAPMIFSSFRVETAYLVVLNINLLKLLYKCSVPSEDTDKEKLKEKESYDSVHNLVNLSKMKSNATVNWNNPKVCSLPIFAG